MPKGLLLIFDYCVLVSWRVKPAFHMLYLDGVYAEDNYGKTGLNQKHSYFTLRATFVCLNSFLMNWSWNVCASIRGVVCTKQSVPHDNNAGKTKKTPTQCLGLNNASIEGRLTKLSIFFRSIVW
jgi:hypothetical protein